MLDYNEETRLGKHFEDLSPSEVENSDKTFGGGIKVSDLIVKSDHGDISYKMRSNPLNRQGIHTIESSVKKINSGVDVETLTDRKNTFSSNITEMAAVYRGGAEKLARKYGVKVDVSEIQLRLQKSKIMLYCPVSELWITTDVCLYK